MNEDIPKIGDKQRESRHKQWEALFEKYENRGHINTDECYCSKVNFKMFIKPPPLKTKFKVRKNKRRSKKKVDSDDTEETDPGFDISREINTANEIYKGTVLSTDAFINIDASRFIDEDSNDIFTPSSLHHQSYAKRKDHNSDTESVDSGVEINDKAGENFESNSSESNTFVNIDVNESIDEGDYPILTETSNLNDNSDCTEVHSTENDRLDKLIFFIEQDLKSDLKIILRNRNVAKLLDSDEYNHWHKCTKLEMRQLEKRITRDDLTEYMRHCCNGDIPEYINLHLLQDVIDRKMNSTIKKLFLKRELSKDDRNKYVKYRKRIFVEWQRLQEVIPLDYLLLYGTSVLYSIEKLKDRTLSSNER